MERVLIINPFGVGDCLFASPLIANLKEAYPQAKITYIANARTKDFLQQDPNIERVIVYERDAFVTVSRKGPLAVLNHWLNFINEIKKTRAQVVFDLSLNRMFGAISWIAGIPKRIGYDYKGRGVFLTDRIDLKGYENKHVVEFYLDLLRFADVPVKTRTMLLQTSSQEEAWAGQWLVENNIKNVSKLMAVIPGGGASWGGRADRKRWPAGKYAQLIDKMVADTGCTVILFGDAKEEGLAQEIAALAASPICMAVGQTSILQMAALLKYCAVAVVNDGGPLHVAVASHVKTVSIFGPVDPVVYGPYPAEGHQVVTKGLACQPCYRRFCVATCSHLSCLQDLSLEDVYRKVTLVYEHSIH